jgi:hypothetical protein
MFGRLASQKLDQELAVDGCLNSGKKVEQKIAVCDEISDQDLAADGCLSSGKVAVQMFGSPNPYHILAAGDLGGLDWADRSSDETAVQWTSQDPNQNLAVDGRLDSEKKLNLNEFESC